MKARLAKKRSSPRASAASLQKRLRQAARRLRELEERYEIAMDAINEGVYDWDIVKDKIFYSESVQRALGLPPEVLRTREDWWNRIHPDDLPRYRAAFVAHFKGETERFECDYRFRALDGSWRWARQHAVALRDKRGRAIRMIGANGDITELKQAEDSLRKSEERYALATSAAVEGIYEWDVDTGKLFLTERAKAFFSFPTEEPTPAAWNTRIRAEDFPGYRAAIVEHFKGHTSQIEHEYRIADGRGGYKWVLDRGIGMRDASGRVTRVVGALSDITQRKRTEIELRRARDQANAALAEQSALRGVLETLSRTAFDLDAVLRTLIESATRLCRAEKGFIFRLDGGAYRLAVDFGASTEFREFIERNPIRPERVSLVGRTAMEARTVHIEDAATDPEYRWRESQKLGGFRTMLGVPIIREGAVIGVIAMWKERVEPFTASQIALVSSFSSQALIAMENARLFNETKEALVQQTATADILRVISGSPIDVQPVFDAIVQSGLKLFSGAAISVALPDGDQVRAAAVAESDPGRAAAWRGRFPFPLTGEYMHGAAILEHKVVDIPDVRNAPPEMAAGGRNFLESGYRGITIMPMMRGGKAIGALSVVRLAPGPLSDRQLALLKTFADQAVIAIENVRLLNETKEALEQQTASGEVLRAISGSIADTGPVFDKILESCQHLFAGRIVGINVVGADGQVRIGAYQGPHRDEFERGFTRAFSRDSGTGRSILEQRVLHYPDIEGDEGAPPGAKRGCRAIGIKSVIFAPMLWEGRGLGAIFVGRDHVSSFSEKEIALLKTFADQAAIAIENARLFREIQEKSQQLEIASRHKSEFLANMSHELRTPLNAIIGFTRIVMRRSQEKIEPLQYENLEKILASGQHLLALINSILDLSKVEAGRVEVHPGHIGLGPVLEHCMRTVEPLIKADTVTFVKDFDGGLPEMYVDEEKLRQIILNLLSNAVKFTERGTIRLRARAANGSIAVAVADTGIGIPGDKLDLIFEEFEQADASSTRVYGGTGLGLTIARRMARLMGGDIRAESAPGSGSTFTLTLPLRYGDSA